MPRETLNTNLLGRFIRLNARVLDIPREDLKDRQRRGDRAEVVAVRTEDGKMVLSILWDDGKLEDFSYVLFDYMTVLAKNQER